MDTIAAIATPAGAGGIGIVRISGPAAPAIAASVYRKPDMTVAESGAYFQSHRLYHGFIADSDRIIDEALVAVMKAPHSYTREDVAEIQAHGGQAALSAIMELVLRRGARIAEPGEFTKRAFLNGRIDLTQAEAVIDIIQAKSARSLDIAASQLKGRLKQEIGGIRDALMSVIAETEAAIDFPEDADDVNSETIADRLHDSVIGPLTCLVNQHRRGHFLKNGVRIVIAGKPNVGKSSLLNYLVSKDRAIVAPTPGTTRDIIEETTTLQGMPAVITDTAGFHETDDPVEMIGIRKAAEAVQTADLVLFMVGADQPLTSEDTEVYDLICGKPVILLKNKSDLAPDLPVCQIPDEWSSIPQYAISVICQTGLEDLETAIAETVHGNYPDDDHPLITSIRHKHILEKTLSHVSSACEAVRSESAHYELVSIDLWEAIRTLGEITGTTAPEDILDQIFSQFCIGK